MYDVVALGELLIDFTTQATDPDGYPTMAAHPGGAPANFLAAIAKFGGKAALLGKVGTDTFGKLLTDTLRKAGIETKGLVASDEFFTTLAFVTLDENGDREFAFARKPGADTQLRFDELDLSIIDEARVFHFGTLSLTDEPARSTTYRTVKYAKAHGKLITFDPNLRKPLWRDLGDAKEQMLWGLDHADVVKIIAKLAKQGSDSAEIYRQQNRADLAEEELAQVAVMQEFLPRQLSPEELTEAVRAVIAEVGATSVKEMGKVMGVASKRLAGQADGKDISAKVRELLG